MKKLFHSCKLNLLQWRNDPKFLFIFFFLILTMGEMTGNFAAKAAELGDYRFPPFLFAFIPSSVTDFSTPVMLAFVLLIADAPFRNRQQRFVLLRTGKFAWAAGQILYLGFASFLFVFLLWVLSWIFLLPKLEWGTTEWGQVWNTLAHTNQSGCGISFGGMKNTGPIEMTLWVAWVMFWVCFLLGLTMMACNLWLKKGIGTVVVSCAVIAPFFVNFFAYKPSAIKMMLWISPVSWMDRSVMGHTNQNLPSYTFGAVAPVVLCLLLIAFLLGTIHKCNLETDKE